VGSSRCYVRACYLHDLSKPRGVARQRVTTNEPSPEAAKKILSELASHILRPATGDPDPGKESVTGGAPCMVEDFKSGLLGMDWHLSQWRVRHRAHRPHHPPRRYHQHRGAELPTQSG